MQVEYVAKIWANIVIVPAASSSLLAMPDL